MSSTPDTAQAKLDAAAKPVWKPNMDWLTRPFFGVLLGGTALGLLWLGDVFALFIGAVTIAAAREWHRMVTGQGYLPFFVISAITIAAMFGAGIYVAEETYVLPPQSFWPWAVIAIGAALNLLVGAVLRKAPLWQAFGVLYIAAPALLLVALRMHGLVEFWVVVGLFVAVWATDTGALFSGNIFGGPKLAPVISPNKTWAGFLGGMICAAIVEAFLIFMLGGNPVLGALYGAGLGLVAHTGDLFESWIKRIFGRKDSGHMIPGHGGVLDRVDSTLFVAPVVAFLVFAVGLDPLFGASP